MSLRGKRTRPGSDLTARVGALEEVLDTGGHRLDPTAARRARALVGKLNERMRLSGEHTVVALAGATGSGKSSLFNALTRLDIAATGARRPTTSTATACVWGAQGADELLEWLQVPRQHRFNHESPLDTGGDALHGLVLLDLPDHDSTEVAHRLEVDRLIELVDVFVWVTDPQKYADAALHRRYLSRLAGHDAVTLVVLNQADRLSPQALEACRADLSRLVAADGLHDVEVATTSATSGGGVDELRERLSLAVQQRTAWNQRLAADLDQAATQLDASVGASEISMDQLGAGTGLVEALSDVAGVPTVTRAVQEAYLHGAMSAAGWPITRWIRRLRPDPLRRLRLAPTSARESTDAAEGAGAGDVPVVVSRSSLPTSTPAQRSRVQVAERRVADQAAEGLPRPWADAARAAAAPRPADLGDALDQAVVGADLALRRPTWWSVVNVGQWLLMVTAALGALWLVGLSLLTWLQLPQPPDPPSVGPLPLPTVLLIAGLALGAVLGAVVRAVAAPMSRRRANQAQRRLGAAIEQVAQERILGPVLAVLQDHRATRQALEHVRS